MKKYLLTIFIFLNTFSIKAQSDFSKDIFLNKTIFAVLEGIKGKDFVKEIDTLFVNDPTLKNYLEKINTSMYLGGKSGQSKDTIIHGIKLRSVIEIPYHNAKKNQPKFFLNYQIDYATDSIIHVSYNLQKIIYKKPFLKSAYYKRDLLKEFYIFYFKSDFNLKESLRLIKSY